MNIFIEPTGNANVLKFTAEYPLVEGNLELDRASDIAEIPLAQALFRFPFVVKIFITANFIAVEKLENVDWDGLAEPLKSLIEDELLENPKIFRPKKKQPLAVFAEMSPNPAVMKFVSTKNLLDGFLELKSLQEADQVPLAKALFEKFDFVKEVFISGNYVSVTKDERFAWHEIMTEVRDFITNYLQENLPVSNIAGNHKSAEAFIKRDLTENEKKINDVLNEYISPAIEMDGGLISLLEFDEETKTAKMLLQGACSGCPSSTVTLKSGIEYLLKQQLPGVVERVEAVND
jgi:Fe-S cluster biogenesis protein NfuA